MRAGNLIAQDCVQCIQIRNYWDWCGKVVFPVVMVGGLISTALLTMAFYSVNPSEEESSLFSEASISDLTGVNDVFLRWGIMSICVTAFSVLGLSAYGCRYKNCITETEGVPEGV